MLNPDELNKTTFVKPLEVKLADVFFFKIGKNLMLVKFLPKNNVHFSVFFNGPMVDFHVTLESEKDPTKKHSKLLEMQFDWQFLIERMAQELWTNHYSIFQRATTNDPEWQDLKVEFISLQRFAELVSQIRKRNRWNANTNFLDKLEKSIQYANLGELTNCGFIIGTSPEGYFVLSNGTDCWILDQNKLSKIIDRNLELSIRRIHLKYYVLRSVFWCVKIRLLNLNRIAVDYLRSRKRQ
jgi:hypothetical protein